MSKIIVAFLLSLSLSFAYLFAPQLFFSLDNRFRDFMFVFRGELPKNSNISIVDIDEKSLSKYGQWPWDRQLIAKLLTNISAYSPGIIGLDIVFAEPDRASPHKLLSKYPQIKLKLPNNDKILANCFENNPIVGGYVFTFDKRKISNIPTVPAVFIQRGMKENHSIINPTSVILNIPKLQNALYSSGFFNNTPDKNGMIRRVPIIMKYDEGIYPSLPLEMARIYSGENRVEVTGDSLAVKSISFGKFNIPTDIFGRLIVNFRGANHHYDYISASDVLDKNISADKITNRFILVGTSALGLYDLRSIAFDSNIAGVEVHANVLDNILKGDFLHEPQDSVLYNLLIIWLIVFFFMLFFSYIKSWLLLPVALIGIFGLAYIFFILLFDYGLVLNLLFPFVSFVLSLIFSVTIDYITEEKKKNQAKKILEKKVSKEVMNYLLKHSDDDLVKPRMTEATLFFSDIVGFTKISEQIADPQKLISLLNDYMTPMTDSIIRHHGTIDKFIGDAIMAYWNAPLEVSEHADKALQSAIEQMNILQNINKILQVKYDLEISIGIGMHTGLVTAGDMGSKGRSDYTVIGDNVNIASRLEGLTRYYGVDILISSDMLEKLCRDYSVRPLDIVKVKGKNQSIEIFEVIYYPMEKELLDLYISGITIFREGRTIEAKRIFEELNSIEQKKLYELYIRRCNEYISNPNKNFNAIYTMTKK